MTVQSERAQTSDMTLRSRRVQACWSFKADKSAGNEEGGLRIEREGRVRGAMGRGCEARGRASVRPALTPKSNTRNRIPSTNCTGNAVSGMGFWGVGFKLRAGLQGVAWSTPRMVDTSACDFCSTTRPRRMSTFAVQSVHTKCQLLQCKRLQ
eukprot:3580613-Rhodomonas_salina.2